MQILSISYRRSVILSSGEREEVEMIAAIDNEKQTEDEFALLKEAVEIALGIHISQENT